MTERTPNRVRITFPRPIAKKVAAGIIAGGSIVGAAAILLSGPFTAKYDSKAIAATPQPAWAQRFEPAQAPLPAPETVTVDEGAETVEAERPQVALENDEKDIDHEAEARRFFEEGDLKQAYGALRKHLYHRAPSREVLLRLGRIGREIGELAVAEQALLDAVAIDPTGADIQTELARVLLDAGEHDRARIAARQALRLDPSDAFAWNVAGRVALAQSEWSRAEASFTKALELDPMNALFHNNAGLLFLMRKDGERAVDALETAVELYDDEAPAFVLNNLGLAHEIAGNLREARDAFEEALVVNPFYARAKVNLRRVETSLAQRAEASAFETASGTESSEIDGAPAGGLEVGDDG